MYLPELSNPTPQESSSFIWKPANDYPLEYLRIGNKDKEESEIIAMEMGLYEERIQFWRDLQAHSPAKTSLKFEL